jgi:hypothetical protein
MPNPKRPLVVIFQAAHHHPLNQNTAQNKHATDEGNTAARPGGLFWIVIQGVLHADCASPAALTSTASRFLVPTSTRQNVRPTNPAFSPSSLASDVLDLRGFAGATVRTPMRDSCEMRGFKTHSGQEPVIRRRAIFSSLQAHDLLFLQLNLRHLLSVASSHSREIRHYAFAVSAQPTAEPTTSVPPLMVLQAPQSSDRHPRHLEQGRRRAPNSAEEPAGPPRP